MKHILTACIIAIALAGCASHKGSSSLKTSKSRSTTATSRPKPKQAPAIKPADDTAATATAAPRPKPAPAPEQTATVEKVTTPEPAAAPEPEADKPITVKGENFTIRQIGDQSVSQSGKEGDYYVGRTEYCSPEVDPEVLIPADERPLKVGRYYNVKIVDSEEFDLYGTTIIK